MTGLHQVQYIYRQRTRTDADPSWCHYISDAQRSDIHTHIEYPAQVAVGENALNLHQIVADNRHAQVFTGDLQ